VDAPGDHQRLQRIGSRDLSACWLLRGEPLVGAAQLRALQGDRPIGDLDRHGLVAVAMARRRSRSSLVALSAQEHCDLGLQCGLQKQPRAQTRDLLNHITKVTAGVSDQLVDLGVDALNG